MMDRRTWIGAVAGSLGALPRLAAAQATERVYRVGVLRATPPPLSPTEVQVVAIANALRELGYVEGRNLVLERRYAGGELDRLPALARELVQARVELVVAVGGAATKACNQVAPALPIVMFGNFDPVALGLVGSLARPGGSITGVLIAPDGTLAGKRLELLKAAVPQATRFAYLSPPDEPTIRLQWEEARKAAAALGVEIFAVEVREGDFARAFTAIAARRPGGLFVAAHTSFMIDRRQIIELAARHRLPAIYEWRDQVHDGGLMAYSTSLVVMYQRIASYVDRILKGARPADMPIERPTKFELVINLKTASAMGLVIPRALLLRADEVIE